MNPRLIYWQRVMYNEIEGSPRHQFAKRMVFFLKAKEMEKRELESSPRAEATPEQVVDRWYEEKEAVKTIKNIVNPKQLLP